MSTTTYSAIKSSFVAALETRVPTNRTDVRFRRYPGDLFDFESWASSVGEGAFRVFDVQALLDVDTVGPFDFLAYTTRMTMQVLVAYPIASLRYGADSDARGDELIEADVFDLNRAIGQPACPVTGATSWPDGLHDSRLGTTRIDDLGEMRILRLPFLLEYQRSNPT